MSLDGDALVVDVDDGVAEQRSDAEILERAGRLLRELRRKGGEDAVGHLHQQHSALARVHHPEVTTEGVPGELADLTGHLNPGRPGADHDEGEPGALALLVGLELGGLEGAQDLGAHVERALQRLHLVRVGLPLVVAEVGVARATGRDQRVVWNRDRIALADAGLDLHRPALEIELAHLAEQDPDVPAPLEDGAQRIRDLLGRERPGGHLVGERLEEMEVAPIDQRHLDRHAGELLDGLQAAEPAADHDHPMSSLRHTRDATRRPARARPRPPARPWPHSAR